MRYRVTATVLYFGGLERRSLYIEAPDAVTAVEDACWAFEFGENVQVAALCDVVPAN